MSAAWSGLRDPAVGGWCLPSRWPFACLGSPGVESRLVVGERCYSLSSSGAAACAWGRASEESFACGTEPKSSNPVARVVIYSTNYATSVTFTVSFVCRYAGLVVPRTGPARGRVRGVGSSTLTLHSLPPAIVFPPVRGEGKRVCNIQALYICSLL